MKNLGHLSAAAALALAMFMPCAANAQDKESSPIKVGPDAVWPQQIVAFDDTHWFISPLGGTSSCGGLFKLQTNVTTGKPEAVRAYAFSNTDTAGCNPVALTVGTVHKVKLLIVTTTAGGENGTGGLLLKTATQTGKVSFPSTVQGAVGASIVLLPASTRTSRTTYYDFGIAENDKYSNTWGTLFAALISGSIGGDPRGGDAPIKLGPFFSIFSLPGGAGGAHPNAPVVQGPDGNLYGTTQAGGNMTGSPCANFGGCGVVYQLARPKTAGGVWKEHVVYTFGPTPDFNDPYAAVTFDGNGNLYTTAEGGGSGGDGGVVMLTPKSTFPWPLTTVFQFPSSSQGQFPQSPVVFDSTGNLYSTTLVGGPTYFGGVVFKLEKSATYPWNEVVLHNFEGGSKDGANPSGGVVLDGSNVWGTTYGGGGNTATGKCPGGGGQDVQPGCGTVFELTPP